MRRTAWCAMALVWTLSSACTGGLGATGGDPLSPPGPPGVPATTSGCGLPTAAFCETFDASSPGGRGGDLDETRWSVTRVTNQVNPGQGQFITDNPANALVCGQRVSGVLPPADFTVCSDAMGSHLTQTMDDAGGTVVSSFRPRQPFDFAGRTGVIAFDLRGRVMGGHGFWPEILIGGEASPAPYQDLPGLTPFPRNAIAIELAAQPACAFNHREITDPYSTTTVNTLKIIRDFVVQSFNIPDLHGDYEGRTMVEPPCYRVSDTQANHYEIRISQDSIELWVTDPGATNLRLIMRRTGLHLPFTRGYVNFQQAHYHQCKDDPGACDMPPSFAWDNLGFDGPVLPAERGYDVPDSLTPWRDGMISLGYAIPSDSPVSFPLAGVDTTNALAASLNMNVFGFPGGAALQYRFNGGSWQRYTSTLPSGEEQRSLHIPVPLELLRAGDNTLELRGAGGLTAGNIDLTIR